MTAIEEVLWNIFTSYSLNGNPRDPSRLNGSGLLKMCRDVMALDAIMTETPLTQAYLDLIYTSEIKSPKKIRSNQVDKSDKLDFDQFLSCLIRIARKCYPSGKTNDESMQQLLMDNILPLAARRKPISIASFLKQPTIETLLKYYEGALTDVFKFYASTSDQSLKGKNMIRATCNIVKTFDDQKELIEEAKTRNQNQSSSIHCIGYADFMRFANDFEMTTHLGLTSLDIGDIYLTVLSCNNFTPTLRKITFPEFWEALIRCAMVAFKDRTKVTTENKIKGLFHFFWRNSQSNTQDHMIGYGTLGGGGFNNYRGTLIKSTQLMNDKFLSAWMKDEYRDYLVNESESHAVSSSATVKLTSALSKSKSQTNLPTSPAPTHTSSLMTKLLSKSQSVSSLSTTATPIKNTKVSSGVWTHDEDDPDAVAADRGVKSGEDLHNLLHESIERRENFTVQTEEGDVVTVTIRDDDKLGEVDSRIVPGDLRRLLAYKPEIAAMLYECLLEEGIVAPYKVTNNKSISSAMNKDGNVSAFNSPAAASQRKSTLARGQSLHLSDLNGTSDNDDHNNENEEESKGVDGDREDAVIGDLVDTLLEDEETTLTVEDDNFEGDEE